jgi:CBS domain-containing protein
MLRLRDIMMRDVVALDPTHSIRDAMELLAGRHLGGAPVMAGGKVIGMVSMTDLLQFAAALPQPPVDRRIESWSGEPDARGFRGDDADMAFYAELWSDAGAETVEQFTAVAGAEWNGLEGHTVSEIMTRDVRSLGPNTPVLAAAAVMTDERIHRVLVMEDEALLGIVTLTDIARAAAAHKLSARTYVFAGGDDFPDRKES